MVPPRYPGPKPRNAYGRLKHKEDLRRFARDLKQAVNACLPPYDKPYGQVAAMKKAIPAYHRAVSRDIRYQPRRYRYKLNLGATHQTAPQSRKSDIGQYLATARSEISPNLWFEPTYFERTTRMHYRTEHRKKADEAQRDAGR
jgi:hypothetical protein